MGDNEPEVFSFECLKFALLVFEVQLIVLQDLKDLMDNHAMFLECCSISHNVIHIDDDLPSVDQVVEQMIHHHLKGCRQVRQSKEHNKWLK